MTTSNSTREWLINEAGLKQGAVDEACQQLLRFSRSEKAFRGSARVTGYMGSGNRNAEVMIVSGSPTESERNTKLIAFADYAIPITVMLNQLGIEFKDVYWTTAIKDDSKVTMDVIHHHRKYIQEEVIYLNPSIIISLGTTALSTLLDERVKWDEVDDDIGYNVHDNLPDIPIISVGHPDAYIDTGDIDDFRDYFKSTWSKIKSAFD